MSGVAWDHVRRNRGAAGVEGETIEGIEERGALEFLLDLRKELISQYADDRVGLCRWQPPERYMPKRRPFLARRRGTVQEDKTRSVDARDGFDFLGVHFRKQPSRRDPSRWFC